MSGTREYIRNGQPHFISSQAMVNYSKKNRKRTYIMVPLVLLFAVTWVAFIGFLFYLNIKFNNDIENHNERIKQQMENYTDSVTISIRDYESQIRRFRAELEELQKKLDKKPSDAQKPIQESESNKFKGVAIENVEEYPDIEDIEDDDLINVNEHRNAGSFIHRNSTKDQQLNEELLRNLHPPNMTLKKKTATSQEELDQEDIHENKRHRRDADFSNSNGLNIIETSRETEQLKLEFDIRNKLPNQTAIAAKNSPSQNQSTCVEKKSQCCPCDETILRKASNLQKNAVKRSMQLKKSQNLEQSSSSGEFEDPTDMTEVRKTVIAAHFGADSSRYSLRTHAHYEGNGHLRHPTGEYEDWRPSSWFEELNMHKHFVLLNGNIKVHSAGLYFVYAQIFYSDLSDVNGYAIFLNSQIVLQCITSTFSLNNATTKSNTCFTGGVIKCNSGDKISVKTIDVNRKVMLESSRSFVGMFKIGELQTGNN